MGNSSDSQAKMADLQSRYTLQGPKQHSFFGQHYLLTSTSNPKDILIKKQIFLNSAQQLSLFLKQYHSIDRKPFSLLYPILLINSSSLQHCSTVREIYCYFQIVGRPLSLIVHHQGPLSQIKAWFLLNQLSKALQILQDSGRAHWGIGPQTVYRNKTKNYLVYDSVFVIGPDPTNFLNSMRDNQTPFSQKTQQLLERGVALSRIEGHQEDMYALGLTLLFAITGIHARTLPSFPERQKAISQLLGQKCSDFSSELIEIIKCLTDRQCSRRIDNNQLRRRLREREADIIKRETLQFQQIYRNSSHRSEKQPMYHTKRENEVRKEQFTSPGHMERQAEMPKTVSRMEKLVIHQTPKHNKTGTFVNIQDVSEYRTQNRESTWETKRSDVWQSNKRAGKGREQPNLTRIQSFDQLGYKS